MFGGEPDTPHEKPGRGVRQGPLRAAGRRPTASIRVGDEEWEVQRLRPAGPLVGPRYWQAPWYYRWLTANVGDDFGFMASRIAKRDGEGTRGGFVWDDGKLHLCDHAELSTEWVAAPARTTPSSRATLRSSRSTGVEASPARWLDHRSRCATGGQTPDGDTLADPHQRGPDRVDHGRRPHRLRASPSTSTRSSTSSPWAWPSSPPAGFLGGSPEQFRGATKGPQPPPTTETLDGE